MDICHKVQKLNRFIIGTALFLSWLLTSFSYGQGKSVDSSWTFAIIANTNLTNISKYRDIYSPNAHAGIGIFAGYQFKQKYDFRLGLKLNTLAYSRNAIDSFENFIQRIREYYLDLPLSLVYYPTGSERIWGLYAGLTPSLLLNKYVNRPEEIISSTLIKPDPSKAGRFDIGVHFGAMVRINPRFALCGDYTYSLTNKQSERYNEGRFSQFSFGLSFQITPPHAKETQQTLSTSEEVQPIKQPGLLLLVRLKTESKRIRSLEAGGYTNDAIDLKAKVIEKNQETIEAFRMSFTVCDVLYFYDTSSNAIVNNAYLGILFTEDGKSADSLIPAYSDVLIAEFASPHSDAFGSSSGFGLVIYDHQFNQMKAPFPYFISTVYGLLSRKEAVSRFDSKLRALLKEQP